MNIFYCVMMFCIGTVFGSFFTLAVYRIPLKKDITHERSFCPNCNHRLEFFDLIPVLSYLMCRGKCRYCGKKIRIRYLLLEVLSGLVFLIEYLALNMDFPFFETSKIAFFISFIFMYVTVVLIAGIDKEYRNVNLGVLLFGLIMQGIYILYLYITSKVGMYRYGMYLIVIMLLYLLYTFLKKKSSIFNYILEVLMFILYISAVIGERLLLIDILFFAILFIIYEIYVYIKEVNKEDTADKKLLFKIRIAFLFGISTVFITICETFFRYYI